MLVLFFDPTNDMSHFSEVVLMLYLRVLCLICVYCLCVGTIRPDFLSDRNQASRLRLSGCYCLHQHSMV